MSEREAKYRQALGLRYDESIPGALRAMQDEMVERVMAIADAEHDALRAEIEQLQEDVKLARVEGIGRALYE